MKKIEGSTKFGFKTAGFDFDGEGAFLVNDWQDLYSSGNMTIKGVIFKQGLSIHAENRDEDITVSLEDCTVYACDQDRLVEEGKEVRDRIDNSGDGLCLAVDTSTSATVDESRKSVKVKVSGCHFIGDDNPEEGRNGYQNWGTAESKNKNKSRGIGVSLGNQSGCTLYLQGAEIVNNTFEGLKGHGVQLYKIGCPVVIKDNEFLSWGINSDTLEGKKEDYAIRGDLKDDGSGSLTLSGNSYANETHGRDLSLYKAAVDNWNELDGVYDQSKAR